MQVLKLTNLTSRRWQIIIFWNDSKLFGQTFNAKTGIEFSRKSRKCETEFAPTFSSLESGNIVATRWPSPRVTFRFSAPENSSIIEYHALHIFQLCMFVFRVLLIENWSTMYNLSAMRERRTRNYSGDYLKPFWFHAVWSLVSVFPLLFPHCQPSTMLPLIHPYPQNPSIYISPFS